VTNVLALLPCSKLIWGRLILVDTDNLNTLFERSLAIFSTIDPSSPNSKGVVTVLNKQMTNVMNVKSDILVEGRALMISVPWHGDLVLRFLAVYSPNDPIENTEFLQIIQEKLKHLPRPDFVFGDFNMVEEALNRLPHHIDPINITNAMLELKDVLGLCNGWRHINPTTLDYSFFQKATGSQSHIDRILVPDESLADTSDWELKHVQCQQTTNSFL
jgi:hypothetical protein